MTIGDKIVETLSSNGVLWKTKQYATLPLPSKQGIEAQLCFSRLKSTKLQKSPEGRVFRLIVSTIADKGDS